jgi:tRNA(Ser,Leu) C12 N-acetylase TAN1
MGIGVEVEQDMSEDRRARLVITGRTLFSARQARRVLGPVVPRSRTRSTQFKSVFTLDAEGDPRSLAEAVALQCSRRIGHVTAVLEEVASREECVREAALRVALKEVHEGESFCFRLHKRGSHWLERDTREIEAEVGGAIAEALEEELRRKPTVDLTNPDVTVVAEVLGPTTGVGVFRNSWRRFTTEGPAEPPPPSPLQHASNVSDRPQVKDR